MKSQYLNLSRNLVLVAALITALSLILAGPVTAQTFTTLYSFTATLPPDGTNSDGAEPQAGLILSKNMLYGTAYGGGDSGAGTVFAVNTDGTGFTNIHSFPAGDPISGTNSDGVGPQAGLVLSGSTLYGTAITGGSLGHGTVFSLNTDGTGFTNLHSFTGGSGGAVPQAGLILSGNTLYGTTFIGGNSDAGTVFAVNTDGTGFTNIHSFTGGSEGGYLVAGLICWGSSLYGTAFNGGAAGNGTVFSLNTNGTGFSVLHSFTAIGVQGNSDGAWPHTGLILSGDTLYGTAGRGGKSDAGTVFAVNTDRTEFTNLHSFTGGSDGGSPHAELILSGDTLYGTAGSGGSGSGTVFSLNTNGTGFASLYSFTAGTSSGPPYYSNTNSDGVGPQGGLILSGNTLYGTTSSGGSSGKGTVFSLTLPGPPQLSLIPSGDTVVLTWPTNGAGFTLQSAPAITGTFTNIPGATNPYTNPIAGAQQYFRLISN